MFIYSVRASTVKFVAIMLFLAAIVGALAISSDAGVVSAVSLSTEIDYSRVKTKEQRIAFMKNFGTVSFLPPGLPLAIFSAIPFGFLPAPGREPPRLVPSFDIELLLFYLILV